MKRRDFLIGASAAAALASCSGPKGSSTNKDTQNTYNWNLCLAVGKTLPIWGDGLKRFAQLIKVMSNGKLNIKVFGSGELVPPLEIFDAVKNGTIEMGHGAAYYWQGKIPAAVFFTTIPFGMNAQGMYSWVEGGGGRELWDELYAPHGVKPIPLGNTGMQMGGWFRKEIKTIADLKGLKIRIPGLGGKVLNRLGASAINIAAAEIFTNLSTGVIDATEWVGPYHDYVMGFYKAAPFYYTIGWHEPGTLLELTINKKAWEALPDYLKNIVMGAAAQVDKEIYSQWMAKDSEYYQKILKDKKITVKQMPPEVIAACKKESQVVIEEIKNSSDLARRICDSFFAFKEKFDAYQNANERAYLNLEI